MQQEVDCPRSNASSDAHLPLAKTSGKSPLRHRREGWTFSNRAVYIRRLSWSLHHRLPGSAPDPLRTRGIVEAESSYRGHL